MPRIPHIIGWAFVLAGVAVNVYESNTPAAQLNPTLQQIEGYLPGNLGLDLPLIVVGAAILTLG